MLGRTEETTRILITKILQHAIGQIDRPVEPSDLPIGLVQRHERHNQIGIVVEKSENSGFSVVELVKQDSIFVLPTVSNC